MKYYATLRVPDATLDLSRSVAGLTLQPRVDRTCDTVVSRVAQTFRHVLWRCRDGFPFGFRSTTIAGVRILLLCAVCGRVRNVAGDWAALPEARWPRPRVVSHGYCPACMEEELRSFSAWPTAAAYQDARVEGQRAGGTETAMAPAGAEGDDE